MRTNVLQNSIPSSGPGLRAVPPTAVCRPIHHFDRLDCGRDGRPGPTDRDFLFSHCRSRWSEFRIVTTLPLLGSRPREASTALGRPSSRLRKTTARCATAQSRITSQWSYLCYNHRQQTNKLFQHFELCQVSASPHARLSVCTTLRPWDA